MELLSKNKNRGDSVEEGNRDLKENGIRGQLLLIL
jgi:hypothetical protein